MFKALMKWMQANKNLPQISDTELQALEAGSVWIDGQFFAGRADFAKVLAEPYGQLSAEEQAFIAGPCNELLAMFNRFDVQRPKSIPDAVFELVKQKGFMSFPIGRASCREKVCQYV